MLILSNIYNGEYSEDLAIFYYRVIKGTLVQSVCSAYETDIIMDNFGQNCHSDNIHQIMLKLHTKICCLLKCIFTKYKQKIMNTI